MVSLHIYRHFNSQHEAQKMFLEKKTEPLGMDDKKIGHQCQSTV